MLWGTVETQTYSICMIAECQDSCPRCSSHALAAIDAPHSKFVPTEHVGERFTTRWMKSGAITSCCPGINMCGTPRSYSEMCEPHGRTSSLTGCGRACDCSSLGRVSLMLLVHAAAGCVAGCTHVRNLHSLPHLLLAIPTKLAQPVNE